jgi:hypothetical protein
VRAGPDTFLFYLTHRPLLYVYLARLCTDVRASVMVNDLVIGYDHTAHLGLRIDVQPLGALISHLTTTASPCFSP